MKSVTYNHHTKLRQPLLVFNIFPSRFFYVLFLIVEICLLFKFKMIIN